jgi:hypothetical protein
MKALFKKVWYKYWKTLANQVMNTPLFGYNALFGGWCPTEGPFPKKTER